MSWKQMLVVAAAILGAAACSRPVSLERKVTHTPSPTEVIVFDTGQGTGQFDRMTYFDYQSEIAFTPSESLDVRLIRPEIWYSNGTSGFIAFVRDTFQRPLGAVAGMIDSVGYVTPLFSDRHMQDPVTLVPGQKCLIQMKVWTTMSVGILTTGERTTGTVGSGSYVVQYATLPERGAIACQFVR